VIPGDDVTPRAPGRSAAKVNIMYNRFHAYNLKTAINIRSIRQDVVNNWNTSCSDCMRACLCTLRWVHAGGQRYTCQCLYQEVFINLFNFLGILNHIRCKTVMRIHLISSYFSCCQLILFLCSKC